MTSKPMIKCSALFAIRETTQICSEIPMMTMTTKTMARGGKDRETWDNQTLHVGMQMLKEL